MSFDDLSARPGQTLPAHLQEVARIAEICGAKIGMGLVARIIGLLHDIGKCSHEFAEYIKKVEQEERVKKGSVDHSTAGGQFAWRNICVESDNETSSLIRQLVALCCISHHAGTLVDCYDGPNNKFEERIGKDDTKTHYAEILENLPDDFKNELIELANCEQLKTEFNIFKEKTEALTQKNKKLEAFQYGLLARFLLSCLIEADHTSAGGEEFNNTPPAWADIRVKLETYLKHKGETHLGDHPKGLEINKLRAEISNICLQRAELPQGTYRLNLPTGSGKTLASLRFGLRQAEKYGLDRIIYIIPYTSIIEQNVKSVREALGKDDGKIVLEHHSNVIRQSTNDLKDGNEEEGDENDYLKTIENWNAPIIFTTSVQLLNAMFSDGAANVRRFHTLARSVLIFDEIQTLPLHSFYLFNNTINFLKIHANTTTLLCTATQPGLDRLEQEHGRLKLEQSPDIVENYQFYFDAFDKHKNLTIFLPDPGNKNSMNIEDMVRLALDYSRNEGPTLFIVNTKKLAKDLYEACRKDEGTIVYHLSTNMCPAHRRTIIDKHLNRNALQNCRTGGKRILCISTQLIEAGVDVDFDVVIKTLSGLDSISQAAGRCNRDGERPSGKIHIIKPHDRRENLDSLDELKEARIISDTIIDELRDGTANSLLNEENIRTYFSCYYSRFGDDYLSFPGKKLYYAGTTLLDMLSINEGLEIKPSADCPLVQSFARAGQYYTVFDDDTTTVIVDYENGKHIINELGALTPPMLENGDWKHFRRLIRQAQQFSISLRDYQLEQLMKEGMIYKIADYADVYALHEGGYTNESGLCVNTQDVVRSNPAGYLA